MGGGAKRVAPCVASCADAAYSPVMRTVGGIGMTHQAGLRVGRTTTSLTDTSRGWAMA